MFKENRFSFILFVLILLTFQSVFCFAENNTNVQETTSQTTPDVPFLSEETIQQFQATFLVLENEFKTEFGNATSMPQAEDAAVIVEGTDINGIEKAFFFVAKSSYESIEKILRYSEKDFTYEKVMSANKVVILFGGPSQNSIVQKLLDEKVITKLEHPTESTIVIYEGRTKLGSKIVVISDVRGFENTNRMEGVNNSPLSPYMPPPAVIATSSLLSILLAFLWNKFGGGVRILAAKLITGKKKATLVVDPDAIAVYIGGFQLKFREVFAILGGILAYTIAVTIAVTGLKIKFFSLFIITIIGGLLFFFLREGFRLIICYFKDLHTEYILWWPGAVLAIFTGWLGNTLNTPGIIVEHKDKEVKFEKYAFVKYLVVLGTAFLGVGLFVYNIIHPSRGVQMFAVISSTYAAAEILPFRPMPGKDIFKWKPVLYIFTLIMIITAYVMFNFVI